MDEIPIKQCVAIMLRDKVYRSDELMIMSLYKQQIQLWRHILLNHKEFKSEWEHDIVNNPTAYNGMYVESLMIEEIQGMESVATLFSPSYFQQPEKAP